eukprot:2667012-Rhodomonas_salina.2
MPRTRCNHNRPHAITRPWTLIHTRSKYNLCGTCRHQSYDAIQPLVLELRLYVREVSVPVQSLGTLLSAPPVSARLGLEGWRSRQSTGLSVARYRLCQYRACVVLPRREPVCQYRASHSAKANSSTSHAIQVPGIAQLAARYAMSVPGIA